MTLRQVPPPDKPEPSVAPEADRAKVLEEQLLRVRADAENFRKRLQKRTEEQVKFAAQPMILGTLEAVDDLEQAFVVCGWKPEQGEDALDPTLRGFWHIYLKLLHVLSSNGVSRIVELDQFDPLLHEIADTVPTSSAFVSGQITTLVRNGYRMHDRVIRAARVIVTRAPDVTPE